MTDLDEELLIGGAVNNTDNDLTDETQDFRFLSSLAQTSQSQSTLPRRGEKDFESHGTLSQASILEASRLAMHDALSHTRTHNPQTAIIGLYNPNDGSSLVERPTGSYFKTVGKADSQGRSHLLPEEALHLVERGSLDLRWMGVEELEGLPLSLQAAYTYMIGSFGLSLERYNVYSSLKRSGYIVQRAPTWHAEDPEHKKTPSPAQGMPDDSHSQRSESVPGFFSQMCAAISSYAQDGPVEQRKASMPGVLIQPGLYRSYAPIYQQLALIPQHEPSLPKTEDNRPSSIFSPVHPRIRPTFHVWKPAHANFRKSAPPPPDFIIAVVDARDQGFPTYDQLDDLLQCMPYDPPPASMAGNGGSQLYGRLKHGHRNVIIAVVDQGVTSYVRVGDAGFGKEKLYNRETGKNQRGAKGGWQGKRGGGRGRGRGKG